MEIMLIAGVWMMFATLVMAWLGTFARWFPIPGLEGGLIKDYSLLIKAHVDFVLMALLNFTFYAVAKTAGIELPIEVCWMIVIGGFTNPSVFVIAMLKPDFWQFMWVKIYTGLSFIISTVGFVWAGMIILHSV